MAKSSKASGVLENELVDLKSMSWKEKLEFNLMFKVRQLRNDIGRLEGIELVGKNRVPSMVAPGLLSESIAKNLKSNGLKQADFSVEELRDDNGK